MLSVLGVTVTVSSDGMLMSLGLPDFTVPLQQ